MNFHLVLQPYSSKDEELASNMAHSLSVICRILDPSRKIGVMMYKEDEKKKK